MDMPFFNPYASQDGGSSGEGGTTDYDTLSNRPVINLTGNNTVITKLKSGVYNIKGAWKITDDDTERTSNDDDIFYVFNGADGCRLTWISAIGTHLFAVPVDGTASDIEEGKFVTAESVAEVATWSKMS